MRTWIYSNIIASIKKIRLSQWGEDMKKEILLTAVLVATVVAVPFIFIKGEEISKIQAKEARDIQNKELYQKANACMDSKEYENALEVLNKLPNDYEDTEYMIRYAEFGKAVKEKENIEDLYRLTWYFPSESEYSGKYAEEMRAAEKDIDVQYEEYTAQKEKEKREEIKKEPPYKGMEEKYINSTSLGKSQEKRKEHYWRNTPGKRTQDIQYRYMWYERNGAKKFMALCRNGKVSSTVEFVHSSGSGNKSAYKKKYDSKDMYDVQDYDDPEDFYYDHIDEFDDVQDAEDYWEEAQ